MNILERVGLKALHSFDPETAHGLTITALKKGLVPLPGAPVGGTRLATNLCGMEMANPIGLAAGFDKNAEVVNALSKAGFGFIEVGAATPRAQAGNPKPRLFRLTEQKAVINRFGFNNQGQDAIAERLAAARPITPVGINLGANKDSENRADDFAQVMRACGPHVDFATVNVSSPNTEKLRDLQGAEALNSLLSGVIAARGEHAPNAKVLLKIAPDLSESELQEIAEVAKSVGIDAIIATNTTLSRDGIPSKWQDEAGGLSGAPLFEKSTRILAQLSKITNGEIPLVGVGGISSAQDAFAKIQAGGSAVQLYSALVYQGFSLVSDIAKGLEQLLEQNGFATVADAIGSNRDAWL
ncbi:MULTISPECIES: quinone-dependent dihydroorotate dehydrogenase [Halocynthiibacter]|uniref:Dihydroorotate dehydrogenase (quinone) n=1 Tax=Halocynthiibacter halioticoli TaxID=2986804 RepID=A0AAE3J205_9RHOB|nr:MULTISPECIES: quinone-dependent dihydroorotate dehydrogenase [Halocynthiibacter]MCV6825186.1 quinone-dependent dihydroorotate dehydrogenase [Halocynthiibacter halioticoli]MCW4058187.1 quinone-dependent dihydroorotate dehydrogenase [Halocynthiibacter sp. SDUM655004]